MASQIIARAAVRSVMVIFAGVFAVHKAKAFLRK
jgi:hypothetical protein